MARLPTKYVLRSLILTSLMSSDTVLRLALPVLKLLASPKSVLLNADCNPLLNKFFRLTIYGQFCAGSNYDEVSETLKMVKNFGYQGVIMGYAKEIVLDTENSHSRDGFASGKYSDGCYRMVEEWTEGTLETLRMIGPGDILAIK